jgi:hypothetical protein
MPKLFLSHSSKDNYFAGKLGADLKKLGHEVWLDEWEIKVGDCIVQKIEEGITDSDYIIIVLTPEAIESGWVGREWKTAFWKEVNQKKVIVLPVLLKKCEIPALISTKRHADFREDYAIGLASLTQAIRSISDTEVSAFKNMGSDYQSELSSLLKKIHSKTVPLSQCFAEMLTIATTLKNKKLIKFCKYELGGWDKINVKEPPEYRLIQCYMSFSKINPNYIGWHGNINNAFSHMESNPDEFRQVSSFQTQPISELESYETSDSENKMTHWTQKLEDINKKTKNPETIVFFYARGTTHGHLLERIRTELTKKILTLLPSV